MTSRTSPTISFGNSAKFDKKAKMLSSTLHSATSKSISFTLHGKPESQPRPGFKGRSRYNPKKKKLETTRALMGSMITGSAPANPFFGDDCKVLVQLGFQMPRPRAHISARGGLRAGAAIHGRFVRKVVDVDNLSKFILDAMTGVFFKNDSQVHGLVCIKIFDNEGECEGSTSVKIVEIASEEDLTNLLGIL